jgi:hypothetical protein
MLRYPVGRLIRHGDGYPGLQKNYSFWHYFLAGLALENRVIRQTRRCANGSRQPYARRGNEEQKQTFECEL